MYHETCVLHADKGYEQAYAYGKRLFQSGGYGVDESLTQIADGQKYEYEGFYKHCRKGELP